MATLTESTVTVVLRIDRDPTGIVRVIAQAKSSDSSGATIRRFSRDITSQLSAGRLTALDDLVDDVEAKAKTFWDIP